jgi:putative solute:sodium symporter small subunit
MSAREPEASGRERYWRRNLRLVASLLSIWFAVSFGAGILLVDVFDRLRIPGTGLRLGFWMAQQGSIVVFVVLIFAYARRMDRIERECGVDEERRGDEEGGR